MPLFSPSQPMQIFSWICRGTQFPLPLTKKLAPPKCYQQFVGPRFQYFHCFVAPAALVCLVQWSPGGAPFVLGMYFGTDGADERRRILGHVRGGWDYFGGHFGAREPCSPTLSRLFLHIDLFWVMGNAEMRVLLQNAAPLRLQKHSWNKLGRHRLTILVDR